jgi:hypothetical protein
VLPEKVDPPSAEETEVREWLSGILTSAAKGDPQALATAREVLDTMPRLVRMNWDRQARAAVVSLITQGNPLDTEILQREAAAKWKEIAGPSPTPLEALLVERIVVCWLQVNQYERIEAERLKKGMSVEQSLFVQKRLDMAHRRYLSAIKALAQVRRLQLPSVQVNIGEKQINVGEQQINVLSSSEEMEAKSPCRRGSLAYQITITVKTRRSGRRTVSGASALGLRRPQPGEGWNRSSATPGDRRRRGEARFDQRPLGTCLPRGPGRDCAHSPDMRQGEEPLHHRLQGVRHRYTGELFGSDQGAYELGQLPCHPFRLDQDADFDVADLRCFREVG